jgi:phosphoribosylpyrophosphate synthetase
VLIAGSGNPELANKVADKLGTRLADGQLRKFADGEIFVRFNAQDVSRKHVYII